MASSEVDRKFLGHWAELTANDSPLLSAMLFKILGLSVGLSNHLIKAHKLRRLDPTRATKSLDLYLHILWLAREGLVILESYVMKLIGGYEGELKVLTYKLRASFYHIFVLFHNQPSVSKASRPRSVSTPPGLTSPRNGRSDKGKGRDRGSPPSPTVRPSSIQPPHPIETGSVRPEDLPRESPKNAAAFLLPVQDYRPIALACFNEANMIAVHSLWGSHPLRLSVKVEFSAFLYEGMHDYDGSRAFAKATIAEVYNAQEGMDDETFEDAAELVGILGRMMKRGLGSGTPGGSSGTKSTPRMGGSSGSQRSHGMDNAI